MNTQKRLIPKGKRGLLARVVNWMIKDVDNAIAARRIMQREGWVNTSRNYAREAAEEAAKEATQAASTSADDIAQRVVTRNADDAVAAANDVVSSATTPSPTRKPRKPRKPKETPAQPLNTSNTPAWLWRTAENSPEWNKWGRYAWNTGVGLSAADITLNGIKGVRAGLDENTEYTPVYAGPPSWTIGVIDAATTPSKQQEQPEKASSRVWIPE